jgi:hypothetical protein
MPAASAHAELHLRVTCVDCTNLRPISFTSCPRDYRGSSESAPLGKLVVGCVYAWAAARTGPLWPLSGDGQRGNALFAEFEDAEDDAHLHRERGLEGGENDTADRECVARDCGTHAHQPPFI